MKKTCPRCGATFECVHSIDCWCIGIKLNEKAKAALGATYTNCLCKKCLEEINEKYHE